MSIVKYITLYAVRSIRTKVIIFLTWQFIFLSLCGYIPAIAAPLANSSNISLITGSANLNIITTTGSSGVTYAPTANNAEIGIDNIEADLANGFNVIVTTTSAGVGTQNGDITLNDSVGWSTTAALTMLANRKVVIDAGASINMADGDINIDANQSATTMGSKFIGVLIEGVITSTGNGSVTIRGRGGDQNNKNSGVEISSSGQINSTGAGAISIIGTGGNAGNNNRGVEITSLGQINSTGAGAISVSGTGGSGGNNNNGVELSSSGRINSTGTGAISITGTGSGTGSGNRGIQVDSASQINSTGTGTVTIIGTGSSNGTNNNFGVHVTDNTTAIASSSGDISITANGGAGSGANNSGIRIEKGGHITGGNGVNITIIGTGGPSSNDSRGIHIEDANSGISSATGTIQLTGTGGTGGDDNEGIRFRPNTRINASAGNIIIMGMGGDGNSVGARLSGQSTTTSGNIMVTGIGSGSSSDIHIGGQGIGDGATTGDITLFADTLSSGNTDEIRSAGNLIIQPRTPSTNIRLGNNNGSGLEVGDGELNKLVAGFNSITIGDVANGTGDIEFRSAIFSDTVIIVGGTIRDGTGTDIDAGTNSVTLDGDISPGQQSLPGVLKVIGHLSLTAGKTVTVDIGGTSPGTGTNRHDQIDVVGTVDISNNMTLNASAINGYIPTGGDTIILINNDSNDAVIGTFSGLTEGITVTVGGQDMFLSYVGGDGNDVVLELPNIQVSGNGKRIKSGDTSPANRDGTKFGTLAIGTSVVHTFTIENNGREFIDRLSSQL